MKWLIASAGFWLAACASAPPESGDGRPFIVFEAPNEQSVDEAITVLQRRVDNQGLEGASVVREGKKLRVTLAEPPAMEMGKLAAELARAGSLTFNLVDQSAWDADYEVGEPKDGRVLLVNPTAAEMRVVFVEPIVGPKDFADARASVDVDGQPSVEFRLTPEGRTKFAGATQRYLGGMFAIVLDGGIISAPRIASPITGGIGQITGNFSLAEADDIARLIRSGNTLPALKVLEIGGQ